MAWPLPTLMTECGSTAAVDGEDCAGDIARVDEVAHGVQRAEPDVTTAGFCLAQQHRRPSRQAIFWRSRADHVEHAQHDSIKAGRPGQLDKPGPSELGHAVDAGGMERAPFGYRNALLAASVLGGRADVDQPGRTS